MLKADLTAAGPDYDTPEGRYDFHALRHQFCSDLVESGANVKVVQALARDSTPVLTKVATAMSGFTIGKRPSMPCPT